MLTKGSIGEMLDRLGKAVSSGDLKGVSACYAFPGLFLVGEEATVFEEPAQFEELFAKGREWYVDRGIVETRADILRFDPITDEIASVDIRWPGFDKNGTEIYSETSHYILQLADNEPLIRLALSRTK
jgi:hypothetical protein